MLGKFPTFSWSGDAFTNWLTQNAVNIAVGIGSGLVNTAVGAATGAANGGAIGGLQGAIGGLQNTLGAVTNALTSAVAASFEPNISKGNTNGGDVTFSSNTLTFHFYKMTVKPEYAKIIDDYFTMFGYKVNRVKVPNISGRKRWNYVKTIDCNIDGNIPQDDLNKIREMFDNGITFWKNASEIENYSLDNTLD